MGNERLDSENSRKPHFFGFKHGNWGFISILWIQGILKCSYESYLAEKYWSILVCLMRTRLLHKSRYVCIAISQSCLNFKLLVIIGSICTAWAMAVSNKPMIEDKSFDVKASEVSSSLFFSVAEMSCSLKFMNFFHSQFFSGMTQFQKLACLSVHEALFSDLS